MYTITLSDGRKLENLSRNSDNYISQTKIDESIFNNNLDVIKIFDCNENTETLMYNVELIQQVHYEDGWYICFRKKSPQEIQYAELKSENDLLKVQIAAATDRQEFLEDCIAEIAMQVYNA